MIPASSSSSPDDDRAPRISPVAKDYNNGPYYLYLLARTYLLVGRPDDALGALETLVKVPYHITPGWLRVDPTWKPLKGNPRFERLITAS